MRKDQTPIELVARSALTHAEVKLRQFALRDVTETEWLAMRIRMYESLVAQAQNALAAARLSKESEPA